MSADQSTIKQVFGDAIPHIESDGTAWNTVVRSGIDGPLIRGITKVTFTVDPTSNGGIAKCIIECYATCDLKLINGKTQIVETGIESKNPVETGIESENPGD